MIYFVFLLFGIGLSLTYGRYIRPGSSDAFLLSVMILPVLGLWIERNGLLEIEAFGIKAKFSEAVQAEVSTLGTSLDALSIQELGPDFETASFWQSCAEVFLINADTQPAINTPEMDTLITDTTFAIQNSIRCGKFVAAIVVDNDKRYIGTYDAAFFQEATALWALRYGEERLNRKDLARAIDSTTIFGAALKFPTKRLVKGEGFISAVNEDASTIEAYRKFTSDNVDVIAITDEVGVLQGVLTKSRTESALLNDLIKITTR